MGGVPTKSFQSQVGLYLDNIYGGVHYHNKALDVIYSHLHIENRPLMSPQAPYIPTWEELRAPDNFRAQISGSRGDEDEY